VDSEKRKGAACAAGASVAYPIARSSGTTKPGKSGANPGCDKENAAPRANLTNAASYGPVSISSSALTFEELGHRIDHCASTMNMSLSSQTREKVVAKKKYYEEVLLEMLSSSSSAASTFEELRHKIDRAMNMKVFPETREKVEGLLLEML
jgi:hypothetical protein